MTNPALAVLARLVRIGAVDWWIARYEEGYVTATGDTVTLLDQLHRRHPWRDPEHAREHWGKRADLAAPTAAQFGNGLMQRDDVRERPEFAALGVVEIWRRVTFVRDP